MQTRRDQLQAYRYLLRRVMSSMCGNDPEALEQPMRRVSSSTFAGIMVGVLACAGVALYGWLADTASSKWKNSENALIIDKDSNAMYLYRPASELWARQAGQQSQSDSSATGDGSEDKVLVEVVNYTSARLILGAEPEIVRVSSRSLEDTPRGPRIGIPAAPNSLPRKENVKSSPLATCSTSETVNAEQKISVDLVIGRDATDLNARPLGRQAVVVASPDGDQYLLYNGKRLAAGTEALDRLNLLSEPVIVGKAFLDAVPAGPALKGPLIQSRGAESDFTVQTIDGTTQRAAIGQVFSTGDGRYYVMTSDGFARISKAQADLLFVEGVAQLLDGTDQSEPTQISPDQLRDKLSPTDPDLQSADLPSDSTTLVNLGSRNGTVCLWYNEPGADPQITTEGTLPESAVDSVNEPSNGEAVDRVLIPAGHAAVLALKPGPDVAPVSYVIITEEGVKYPVPNMDTLRILGYDDVDPMPVAPSLLRQVRSGPALSQDAAYQVVSFGPSEPAE